jgi:hypothetical protein
LSSSSDHSKNKKKFRGIEVDIDSLMNGELIPTPSRYQDPSFDPGSIDPATLDPESLFMSNGNDPFALLQSPRSAAAESIPTLTSADTLASYSSSPRISTPQANLTSFTRRLDSISHDILLSKKEDQPQMIQMLQDWAKRIVQHEPQQPINADKESPTINSSTKSINANEVSALKA